MLVSDDLVFTEAALTEFVDGRAGGGTARLRRSHRSRREGRAKKTAAKKAAAKKTAAVKAAEAGETKPAGEGVSDEDAVAEVAEQTSSDLKAEDVFEREAEGTATDARPSRPPRTRWRSNGHHLRPA